MQNEPQIIHADDFILAINKPASLASASAKFGGTDSLSAWITAQFPTQTKIGKEGEAGLVHRLDNDTSGIILAARTAEIYKDLRLQFDAGLVKKEYAALVIGRTDSSGEIKFPIAHHPRKKKKMIACATSEETRKLKGRLACTRYELNKIYRFQGCFFSFLSVVISTGVRHQIRVHLAAIGHPIVGDRLYQNFKIRDEDKIEMDRHFLHATKITVRHPSSGEIVTYESPLDNDLANVLKSIA